jgi:hypothetical protein
MGMLQDTFDRIVREEFSISRMGARVLDRRFAQLGITLTDAQKKELASQLQKRHDFGFTLHLDDSQVPAHVLATHRSAAGNLSIDVGDCSPIIEEFAKAFTDQLPEVLLGIASDIGDFLTKALMRDSRRMLKARRKEAVRYESRLLKSWQQALDGLETMLVIATEAGDDVNQHLRARTNPETPHLIEAATRLHARSCQIASEVLTLLKSGYSDGAHARWRCLHEVAVVLFFLLQKGEGAAEAYLLHDAIESYRAAMNYQQHCERLGYDRYTDDEMKELADARNAVLERYGSLYGEDYGWAAIQLNKKHTTFRDIENTIEMNHMRPYYRMASHNVHANPKGILFRLGLSRDDQSLLLAGPSVYGLTDPGQGAAISILQTTTALLTIEPNLDRLVLCHTLKSISEQVQESFLEQKDSDAQPEVGPYG